MTSAERLEWSVCKAKLQPLGVSLTAAVDAFVASQRPRESRTLSAAWLELEREMVRANNKRRYIHQLGYDITGFIRSAGDRDCRAVTTQDISDWIHGNGWEKKTCLNKSISLGTFFSFMRSQKWIDENPCAALKEIQVDSKKPGILTPDEAALLMRAAREHPREKTMVPYLALVMFAGVRPEEVKQLRWEDISDGVLRVESSVSKVRRHRLVLLSANCQAWLKLGGDLPPVNWQDSLAEIRRSAGFESTIRGKRKGQPSVRVEGRPWPHNCMRHSFCSYSLMLHGLAETARQAGNSETMVHQHYKALVTREAAEKFFAIMPG